MTELATFFASDTGFIIGLVLTILGLSDVAAAFFITRRKPDFVKAQGDQWFRMLGILLPAAVFMFLCGLYILSYHVGI